MWWRRLLSDYYNPELDIAPVCGGGDYYPMPNLCIDFDDFVVFGWNYKDYNCANTGGGGDKLVVSEMAIAATVPDRVKVGDEFKVVLTAEHARAMLAYHLVIGYDQENLELVNVTPGLMHESVQKAFFYNNNETGVDISAVALGGEFTGEEMLEMTFRSNFEGSVELTAETIDVRDWTNNVVDVAFDVTLAKSGLPTEFALSQNYPNPFNPATSIELSLPVACKYTLDIYNITGQLVESISGYSEGGIETVTWDASALSSGIYLYRLEAGSFRDTKKMVLLK